LIYLPNLKLKKKKKFMSSRVFYETIHSVFAMRFFCLLLLYCHYSSMISSIRIFLMMESTC
jgi:hypothetical protein